MMLLAAVVVALVLTGCAGAGTGPGDGVAHRAAPATREALTGQPDGSGRGTAGHSRPRLDVATVHERPRFELDDRTARILLEGLPPELQAEQRPGPEDDDRGRTAGGPRTTVAGYTLDHVGFAVDDATLTERGVALLDALADRLLALDSGYRVTLFGSASSEGTAARNEQLATQRAASVRDHLVDRGVPAGRVRARGAGTSLPVASNCTEDGRRRNRRVDIEVGPVFAELPEPRPEPPCQEPTSDQDATSTSSSRPQRSRRRVREGESNNPRPRRDQDRNLRRG
jgi:outer membrane protein OmpA-like peptidoglycan-associated protein